MQDRSVLILPAYVISFLQLEPEIAKLNSDPPSLKRQYTTIQEFEIVRRHQHLRGHCFIIPMDLPVKLYQKFSSELTKHLSSGISACLSVKISL